MTTEPREALTAEPAPTTAVDRETLPATPVDAGARALMSEILARVELPEDSGSAPLRIGLGGLRNQSHASADEFETFCGRLATLLNVAAPAGSVRVTSAAQGPADLELKGAAYLVQAHGFDQWMVFMRLTRSEADATVWESPGPVLVLRHPRPDQPQILYPTASRR